MKLHASLKPLFVGVLVVLLLFLTGTMLFQLPTYAAQVKSVRTVYLNIDLSHVPQPMRGLFREHVSHLQGKPRTLENVQKLDTVGRIALEHRWVAVVNEQGDKYVVYAWPKRHARGKGIGAECEEVGG